MANYLSKPVASPFQDTYISQYVPLPLAQFARAQAKAENTQQQYEDLVGNASDSTWKIQGIADADNKYVDSIRSTFDKAATDLASKDLTQRENQDIARNLVKNVSRDKDLATIMSNTAKVREYQEAKQKMIEAGTYHPANDNFEPSYSEYVKNGGYKSGKSIDPTIYKYEDSEPIRKQYFDDLQKLGDDKIGQIGDQFYKYGLEGISEARIGKQAHAAIRAYMGTTAAAQDGRMYDLAVRKGQIDPKKLTKDKYILDGFITTGMERAGLSYHTNADSALTANAKEKKEDFSFGTLQTQGQNTLATGGYTFDDSDYDKEGNFTGSGKTFMQVFKDNPGNPGAAITEYFTNKDLNRENPKDVRKVLLQTAAHLNGMNAKDYTNSKAGPDVKISTTFHALPTKQQTAADNQLYDMQRNSGVFNNIPVMDLTTSKQGSMVEILRQLSKDGQLKNKKGEVIKLSDNPTIGEAQEALGQGIKVLGKQDPNHFSAKSYIVGLGGRNIALDVTYGGTQLHDVNKQDQAKSEYERLKVSPEKVGEGDKAIIKWYNERTFVGKDGNTYKAGSTYATPLNEIDKIR